MLTLPFVNFQLEDVLAVAIVSAIVTFLVAYYFILKDFDPNIRFGTSARMAGYSGLGTYGAVKYGLRPPWAK